MGAILTRASTLIQHTIHFPLRLSTFRYFTYRESFSFLIQSLGRVITIIKILSPSLELGHFPAMRIAWTTLNPMEAAKLLE